MVCSAFVIGGIVIVSTIVAMYHRAFQRDKAAFIGRHLEATKFIACVYEHFQVNGSWPTQEEVGVATGVQVPAGWQYVMHPDQGSPVLLLHGRHHMMLAHEFAPSSGSRERNSWGLSIEGDKSWFASAAVPPENDFRGSKPDPRERENPSRGEP